jgi:hypothetical protein
MSEMVCHIGEMEHLNNKMKNKQAQYFVPYYIRAWFSRKNESTEDSQTETQILFSAMCTATLGK